MAAAKPSTANKQASQKGIGIRSFVFILMLIGALVPISINSFLGYGQTRDRVLSAADEALISENQNNAEQVNNWIDFNLRATQTLATASEVYGLNIEATRPYLQRIQKQYPWFYTLYAVDTTGMQTIRSDDLPKNKVADRVYFKKSMAGDPVTIQFAISKATNKPALLSASPVRKPGSPEIIGMIGGAANMDAITDKVTGGKIGETGFSYLVSSENVILAHPKTALIGTKLADTGVLGKKSKVMSMNAADGHSIKVVASPAGSQLTLISQIDTAEVEQPLKDEQRNAAMFLGLAVLLAGALSFALGRSLSGQINSISGLADRLSKAKSADEIKEIEKEIKNVGGTREVRSLAQSIQRLANSIKLALEALS